MAWPPATNKLKHWTLHTCRHWGLSEPRGNNWKLPCFREHDTKSRGEARAFWPCLYAGVVGARDRSQRVYVPHSGLARGRERVKSWLPWLMLQSSCPPLYNNTGSTKTGSTKLQPKSSDALTQKIPSPPWAAQGTAQTHTSTHISSTA